MSVDEVLTKNIIWYTENRPRYEKLSETIQQVLENTLRREKIKYWRIEQRTKTIESYTEKLKRKKYQDPEECRDLSGIRIIVSMLLETENIADTVKKTFRVVELQDRSLSLKPDQFGYRSIHLVATLSEDLIPGYNECRGMFFEVQARTVIQHIWTEFEHSKNYKSIMILPPDLQRKLYRLAVKVEEFDDDFQKLSDEIEEYSKVERNKHKEI